MAQAVRVLLDDTGKAQFTGISSDRSHPLKHILLWAERLSVQHVARQAGVSRPAGLRWQQRYGAGASTALPQDEMQPSGLLPDAHIILALLPDWIEDYRAFVWLPA